jgi:hypothetical protein
VSAFGKADTLRRRMLSPLGLRAYLLARLPLALCAGVRIEQLDETVCVVSLPGGWRTRNPFGSTYFAAQAMAAEMSTGAPAVLWVAAAPVSVAVILVEVRATFVKRVVTRSRYRCEDVDGLRQAVERAAAGSEPVTFTARSLGSTEAEPRASEFEVTWSFKRRS